MLFTLMFFFLKTNCIKNNLGQTFRRGTLCSQSLKKTEQTTPKQTTPYLTQIN